MPGNNIGSWMKDILGLSVPSLHLFHKSKSTYKKLYIPSTL